MLVASTIALSPASAQSSARGPTTRFKIPSQSLESALDAYVAASRMQVLYETALTVGRRSTEVDGVYTQETGLRRLLSGTGLEFQYTEESAFTVVPTRGPPARLVADFYPFLGSVQAAVLAALCRRPESRPGAFRMAFQFWIGASGSLEGPSFLGSSGSAERDAAITDVLTHLTIGRAPPADMPQPITMVLKAGADNADECGARR